MPIRHSACSPISSTSSPATADADRLVDNLPPVDADSTDPTALTDDSGEVAAQLPVASTFGPDDQPAAQVGMDSAVFDGEIVLFDPEHRMLHRLDAIAGAVWLCCDGATSVAEMCTELAEVFDAAAPDVALLIDQALAKLAAEGLLVGFDGPMRFPLLAEPELSADGRRVLAPNPDP